jgi:dipeptidyl aminopeptidase/acylaminoacyl peptidase
MALRGRASIRDLLKRSLRRGVSGAVAKAGASATRALISTAFLCVIAATSNAAAPDPLAVAFGTMPALWNVRLSPDGTRVSFLQMHPENLSILTVFDLATGKANLALASTRDGFELKWCNWANGERLLCSFYGISRAAGMFPVTRLVAVNADGSEMKVLVQNQVEGTYSQYLDGVVDWLVDDPRRVLVEVPNFKPGSVDVYRRAHASSRGFLLRPVDIYSGNMGGPVEKQSGVVHWESDGHGSPRLYRQINSRQIRWRYRPSGKNNWRRLHTRKWSDLENEYYPLGFGEDADRLFVLKPHEGRLALWAVDLKQEKDDEVVFSHPLVDVDNPVTLGKFRRIVAIGYSTDKPHLHFFDETVEKISEKLTTHFSDKIVNVTDESWDRRYYIAHVESDQSPGVYYRFDSQEKRLEMISSQYPKLHSRSLSPVKFIRYPARDGTEIPSYLTLPSVEAKGPLPAVILPHGGPSSRDYWQFDWLVQFLAAKGYAVLQSNYRGSGGYGREWRGDGGFRAWRMAIGDLTDGAQYLVAEGIADAKRVCVVGWSYGGYAALMSGLEEPKRYRCLVSIAGVADPGMLKAEVRFYWGKSAVYKFIGTGDETIEHGSPLKRASEIRAPVLLFHGNEDLNVAVDHSRKMTNALKRARKSVEYIEYDDVKHSIYHNDYRIDMLDRIGSFLDTHIGQSTVASEANAPGSSVVPAAH